MKVIFMGTPEFSVGTLKALVEAGHDVVLAVTQPDKPKGRGKAMQMTPVKEAAIELGIPVFQPIKIREAEAVKRIKECQADVCVVVAFGQILPESVLKATPLGCINVHASLLPKYRGAAPIQWAIIDGELQSGVTTMQMDAGLDTGDMILKTVVPLEAKETGGSLHDKLAKEGAMLCVKTLAAIQDKTATFEPQPELSPTPYAKMLDKEMGNIVWNQEAEQIEALVRGLNPWPTAYTTWRGKRMKIWDGDVIDEVSDMPPGTIVRVAKDAFYVSTLKGLFKVNEVQLPGKKRMSVSDFLRGNQMETGEVLRKE